MTIKPYEGLEFMIQIVPDKLVLINSYLDWFGAEILFDCDRSLVIQTSGLPFRSGITPCTLNGSISAYQRLKYGDYIVCKNHNLIVIPSEAGCDA